MTHNWKKIWNNRIPESESFDLAELIRLDGFDTGAGRIEMEDWKILTSTIGDKIGLQDGDSVFEVGCGAGAFLYSLLEKYNLSVGGIDYGATLINAAKQVMPSGDWKLAEAIEMDIEPVYDYVISHGVFHYFGVGYAEEVLDRMIRKARKGVAILEIPDLETKEELERIRRDILSVEEYNKKYAGLEHTYYDKDWFAQKARDYNMQFTVFGGCIPNYAQNDYRFGVILKKNDHNFYE